MCSFIILRGETGIRTPDTLLTYTRFPGVPLQPLEHLSITILGHYIPFTPLFGVQVTKKK